MPYFGVQKPNNRVADVKFDFSSFNDPSSHEDERSKLWGIIPEDYLPEFYKQGYNNSIEGMAYQMITGKQFFDDIDPNNSGMIRDVMATIASFITPTDLLAMATGTKLAGKALSKYGSKTMQVALKQTNLPKSVLAEAVEKGTLDAVSNSTKAGLRASLGAGGFGFYSGLQSAELEVLQQRDMGHIKDLADATKAFTYGFGTGSVHGAAIGAVTGGLGQLGRMAGRKTTSRLSTRTQNAAAIGGEKGIEIAAFGSIPSIEDALKGEFRLPRPEEWVHAAGVVGGLGLAKGAFKVRQDIKDRYDKKLYESIPRKELKAKQQEVTETFIDKARRKLNIGDSKWIDADGNIVAIKRSDYINNRTGKLKDVGDGTINFKYIDIQNKKGVIKNKEGSGKNSTSPVTISRADFFKKFSRLSEANVSGIRPAKAKKGADKSDPHGIITGFQSAINKLRKKIKVKDKTYKEDLHKLGIDPEVGPKNQQQYRSIHEHYKRKETINEFIKDKDFLTGTRNLVLDLHKDGILKERLPEPIYRMISGFKQTKNKITHPIGQFLTKRMRNADQQEFIITSDFLGLVKNAGYGKGKNPLTAEQNANLFKVLQDKSYGYGLGVRIDEKGRLVNASNNKVIDIDVGGINPGVIRKIFEDIYRQAEKSNIPIKGYIEGYLPSMYSQEVLEKISKDIDLIFSRNKELQNALMSDRPYNKKKIETIIKNHFGLDPSGAKAPKGRGLASSDTIDAMNNLVSQMTGRNKILKAFNELKHQSHSFKHNVAYHLEKSRTLKIPDHLREQDIGKLLTRYISQYAKRKAQVDNFGVKNEIAIAAKEVVAAKRPNQAEILEKAFNVFTGNIERMKEFNYTPYWKNFWTNATKFQVATKIGMGFGAVVNLTQPLISTLVAHGYSPMIKGMWKFRTNKSYRNMIEKAVGFNNMDVLNQIFGGSYKDMGFFGKFADFTTTKFGFHGINKWNFNTAVAAQYEYLLKNQRIANGKGLGSNKSMRELAKKRLAEHGLNAQSNLNLETASKATRKKIQKSLYEFGRDSQLQKNILNDPLFFNDPRFRPFVLFKRFGYRQANWLRETMRKEWYEYKNPLPILRLAAGGFAGGLFMGAAKQFISEKLAGNEDIYNENYSIPIDLKAVVGGDVSLAKQLTEVTAGEIIDTIAMAGGFGLVGDIIASEERLKAAEFFVKPAHYADAEKIYKTLVSVYEESDQFGIDAAVRRGAVGSARLLGALPGRIATNFQTKQQEDQYLTFRKGVIKSRILDAIIAKNKRKAMRILKEWNEAYPEKRLTYDDIGAGAVLDRIKRKRDRRREVQLDLPPR